MATVAQLAHSYNAHVVDWVFGDALGPVAEAGAPEGGDLPCMVFECRAWMCTGVGCEWDGVCGTCVWVYVFCSCAV